MSHVTAKPMAALAASTRLLRAALPALALSLLAGCGGGASTEQNQPLVTQGSSDYSGPPPATADVQAFMVELWSNLRASGTAGCGDCHSQGGGQSPMFARDDDVNLAYSAANAYVNLAQPGDSVLVSKVGGGHNCWLGSNQACADIMTNWIEAWAGGAGSSAGREIELQAPVLKDPGQSKNFPPPVPAEYGQVHDLLTTYCAGCHSNGAGSPQSPFFAESDIAVSYEAAKPKMDLDDPASSRFVIRLRDEFHNCWDNDCPTAAAEMQAAIQAFADSVTPTEVPDALIISKALQIGDGTVASGGNRYENNLVALWEFKAGQGLTAYDTSGVAPAVDLSLSGDVEWVGGWGIDIKSGKAQASTTTSRKLHDLIKATGEYAIEAWVAPGNVVQEDSRIISYSAGTQARNFTLGQTMYSYDFFNRSSSSLDGNGNPVLTTSDADEDLQATLQHVVANYDPVNGRRIYVNGVYTDDPDPVAGGTLNDWDNSFAFVLGNEVSGDRQWQGVIRMVAIHNRALTDEQIQQNLAVGVGEKFFLLFSISHLVTVPQAYILFEVSQFDNYSYLFNKPTFISLDPTATSPGIPLVGLHIGVNGALATVGQAFANLNVSLDDPSGQLLADLGTVIPLEKGPEADEFFLSFDQLGTNFGPVLSQPPVNPPPELLAGAQSDIGLRTFDEINASMAAVTGVPATSVQATFDQIRQQLPTNADVMTFSSAQQIGIAQLAIAYCNVLVEDSGRRAAFFPGFNFGVAPATAFADRDLVIMPLLDEMMGINLATQPDYGDSYDEVSNLIDALIAGTPPPGVPANSPQRTLDITKAACASVLGSAPVLVQ